MAAAMRHRGPDGEGFLIDPRAPGLALAMRRLSIIDLAGGQQPIWNEALDVGVVFNGELYNYRELRERLKHLAITRTPLSGLRLKAQWVEPMLTAKVRHLAGAKFLRHAVVKTLV